MTGLPQSGKSNVAETISKVHKRALIKFDEIVDWVINSGSETGNKIKTFLDERKVEQEKAGQ